VRTEVRIFTHVGAHRRAVKRIARRTKKNAAASYGLDAQPRFFTPEEDKIFRKPLFFE
jgi:hypothetical protein